MKPPQDLPRTTPPIRKTPMPRGGVARNAGPRAGLPKPRRSQPAVPLAVRMALAVRSGGRCEMFLPGCTVTAVDPAHRIRTGMGGRKGAAKVAHDVLSNILHACRPCHSLTHANPTDAYDLGLMLREWQDPTAEPVLYRGERRWLTDGGMVLVAAA